MSATGFSSVTPPKGSLANVMAEFDAAAKYLKLDEDEIAFIKEPRCSITLRLPVRLDDGRIKTFRAYHTIHSIIRGPAIGGVQFRTDIDQETVDAIASWSTHRSALLGIPFGGSAGAVVCDPASFSVGELERVTRRYIAELMRFVGPNNDILFSDIGANQQTMCWFMDSYSAHAGQYEPAVVLGKPVGLGGTSLSMSGTAIGADLCIRKACARMGISIKGARVAIQGFGKVGMNVAKLLYKDGAKIVGIADISGAYVNEKGIDVSEVVWHQQSYGILDGLEGEANVTKLDEPAKFFELPVDIIILAAVELEITADNMRDVKAKIVAEIAHDPVSPEADRYLHEKGVFVIPDVLCNAGGSASYYFEWVQNREGYYWSEDRMKDEIRDLIGSSFEDVAQIAEKERIPLRLAAAVQAVRRVSKTASLRGIYA